jgi:hypothetical protein
MTARDALGFRRMENPDIVPVANDMYKNDYRLTFTGEGDKK